MASIIKRGKSWRAMIVRNNQRVSAIFDTRAEAENWAMKAEAKILNGERAVEDTNSSMTIADLLRRYLIEVSPQKRGYQKEKYRLNYLSNFPVFNIPLSKVTPQRLASWRDYRLKEVAPSTVNRDLNLISSVFTTAKKEWGVKLSVNFVQMIKRPSNPPARRRRITPQEQNLIIRTLGWDGKTPPKTKSQWVAFAFLLALETAMRRGEILSIIWKNIHLEECYIYLPMTKNGESRSVPLSSKALFLLKILEKQDRKSLLIPVSESFFSRRFIQAKKELGIENMRFHDTRREATTQLSKRLSNVLELSAVTGHKTLSVLKIYYQPDVNFLAKKIG